jgi:hypothetical protein
MMNILIFLLLLQVPGTEIRNDTENHYLIKTSQGIVMLSPRGLALNYDSLVYIQEIIDDTLVKSIGWAHVNGNLSQAEYLVPCIVNNTPDSLLIAENRISFTVSPGQRYCLDQLYVDFEFYINLEIYQIKKGVMGHPSFQILKANNKLEIFIAP